MVRENGGVVKRGRGEARHLDQGKADYHEPDYEV
jgi:hypothetical protein